MCVTASRAYFDSISNDKAVGEVVNIGSTQEVTIEDLANRVKQRTESNSPITHVPYDQAYEPGFEDMPRRVPALEKLEALTGFRPAIPLNDIVDGVIGYFRDKQEAAMSKSVTSAQAVNRAAAGLSAD